VTGWVTQRAAGFGFAAPVVYVSRTWLVTMGRMTREAFSTEVPMVWVPASDAESKVHNTRLPPGASTVIRTDEPARKM
jgi:hypothetical protein